MAGTQPSMCCCGPERAGAGAAPRPCPRPLPSPSPCPPPPQRAVRLDRQLRAERRVGGGPDCGHRDPRQLRHLLLLLLLLLSPGSRAARLRTHGGAGLWLRGGAPRAACLLRRHTDYFGRLPFFSLSPGLIQFCFRCNATTAPPLLDSPPKHTRPCPPGLALPLPHPPSPSLSSVCCAFLKGAWLLLYRQQAGTRGRGAWARALWQRVRQPRGEGEGHMHVARVTRHS